MFDWIPLPLYNDIYQFFILGILFFVLLGANAFDLESRQNKRYLLVLEIICIIVLPLYMGLRPVSGAFFGDMYIYDWDFFNYKTKGAAYMNFREPVWEWYIMTCAKFMTAQDFFLLTAYIYIIPIFLVSKRFFKELSFLSVFFLLASFSFWSYGTNGLRNGVATSLFLLIFIINRRWLQVLLVVIIFNIHKSMSIPALAYLLAQYIRTPKKLLIIWVSSIVVSFFTGAFFQFIFGGFMDDNRSMYLTDATLDSGIIRIGFRWDFILYSAFAIFAGWYYIVKLKYTDKIYISIWATYLITNAFWIIVIRAAYSNRFAYLSWFMMALVIIYPLLRRYFIPHQYRLIGYIGLFYFAFTFFMNVIL